LFTSVKEKIMLILRGVTYAHPNKDILFNNLDMVVHARDKVALVGNNGVGKSTLLRIIAGLLVPVAGVVQTDAKPYYVPQHFGQFDNLTVAEALLIDDKLTALQGILAGEATEANMALLDDDWLIEERCKAAFAYWGLAEVSITQPINTLSGGQKTKVFLAGIDIHEPELVLMDEPSNHMDVTGRQLLHDFVGSTNKTIVLVSHDRKLLQLPNKVYELSKRGITVYGGNYTFYKEQKDIAASALQHDVHSKEKELRKAKETAREAIERQQKLDARGKSKQAKAGMPTIMMNTMRNNAEKSTARIKGVHGEKTDSLADELTTLRQELPAIDQMKLAFGRSALHSGKILVTAQGINYGYNNTPLWQQPLDVEIRSGERVAIKGGNGSGKTTLLKLLLGQLQPTAGSIDRAVTSVVQIDQDYSLIDNSRTVYEQAQQFNGTGLEEHEVKIYLARFLFTKEDWDKPCAALSGGEKMRLMLCCLSVGNTSPDIVALDEPTNNLDIQNMEILTAAVNEYSGTLLLISHDEVFLQEVGADRIITV
jgi:ATPase subunit of ABC transporter with duplicated ATPase domains